MNGFGVIDVKGSVTLDGTLSVQLADSYLPPLFSRFRIMDVHGGTLVGAFSDIENDVFNNGTERWIVDYASGSWGARVDLIAADINGQTPELSTLLLLGSGVMFIAGMLRQKSI